MRRRDIVAAAAGAVAAVVMVLAGSVAWAAIPGPSGVIQGCYDSGGNVKVVEALPCPRNYTPFQWNQQGPPGLNGSDGAAGVSPSVAQLAAGDPNCPAGGAAITDAAGTTALVCSGLDGADGQAFSGTFTSPNGEYSIGVTNAGITLSHGPGTFITLVGDDIRLRSTQATRFDTGTSFLVMAGLNATVNTAGNLSLRAGGSAEVDAGGVATIDGSVMQIKSGATCRPAARVGDLVNTATAPNPGPILTGSPQVCIG